MTLLHDYAAEQAERRPEATALVDGAVRVAYGELHARACRLARLLRSLGLRSGDRVAIVARKSAEAVTGMLATLEAGGIYVPVDPTGPPARTRRILMSAACEVLLIDRAAPAALAQVFSEPAAGPLPAVVWIDAEAPAELPFAPAARLEDAVGEPATRIAARPSPDTTAHLLFTSGSTGAPKGVMVTHANVVAFVTWANRYFGVGPDDRLSCHSPLHFDLSGWDLYGGFAAGAEIHLIPPDLNLFPGRLAALIRERRLTQWFSVPSLLAYMARFEACAPGDFPELRRMIWCGEVFPTPALIWWMRRLPHVRFTNLYGPTETTIASSYYTVPAPPDDPRAPIPIGRACEGEELLVLDQDRQPVAPGALGHIWIAGAGVTPGYWRDSEGTAAAFVARDACRPPQSRMYRTGDLGALDADGLAYFRGRADSQVKVRGHRVELGEIESVLETIEAIAQSAVVGIAAPRFGGTEICCAFAPHHGIELAPPEVRRRLASLVPDYMLPARWLRLDALPHNANGKIDRAALRARFERDARPRHSPSSLNPAPLEAVCTATRSNAS